MSPPSSTGSPTLRRTPGAHKASLEQNVRIDKEAFSISVANQNNPQSIPSVKRAANPLETSVLTNQGRLKRTKLYDDSSASVASPDPYPMDELMLRLSNQRAVLHMQKEALKNSDDGKQQSSTKILSSSSSSLPITPAADSFNGTAALARSASAAIDEAYVDESFPGNDNTQAELKIALARTQSELAFLKSQGISAPFNNSLLGYHPTTLGEQPGPNITRNPELNLPMSLGRPSRGSQLTGADWSTADDWRSDYSDVMSVGGPQRSRDIWGSTGRSSPYGPIGQGNLPTPSGIPPIGMWNHSAASQVSQPGDNSATAFYGSPLDNRRNDRLIPDYNMTIKPAHHRRGARYDNRHTPPGLDGGFDYGGGNTYNTNAFQYGNGLPRSSHGAVGLTMYPQQQPRPIRTSLSPLATEFTSTAVKGPWKPESVTPDGQTFIPTSEPVNYRRLLDRDVSCDWKYVVDQIVCDRNQQASIFLQQKLKSGSPEQKYEIIETIILQAYDLMRNRFGNFLIQRCFEHGTPDQVVKIAEAIRGKTVELSMDQFGCHVVQKALDSVPEDYKALMVHELLQRIPATVIHRYACHVWQKLFELRWTKSPPQFMNYVNEALRGMWHEVALGKTGSLVVQNIFENCLEEDKRPCIEEVLGHINIVAEGQFGNWCIQHICEHGAPVDRSRAIDHVIRFAADYSTDQYASKVVEKCLKIGGSEFLSRYLNRICEGHMDRPRIPLIDIASDQYGNYLVQWILLNADDQHRDVVASHIRKHMVSLRGSKYGARLAAMCADPAVVTRPGPGAGNSFGRGLPGSRYRRSCN